MFKRLKEMEERPKLVAALRSSINISQDFSTRMKNLSEEVQIFTKVEMDTLETLTNETEVGVKGHHCCHEDNTFMCTPTPHTHTHTHKEWINDMEAKQNATASHEDPILLSYDLKDHLQRLEREIMYLLNKLRTHPPPKLKRPLFNATNMSNATNTPHNTTDGNYTVG